MRPTHIKDIIGQDDIVKCLNYIIESSSKRKDSIPHILYEGTSGCGKTTLAIVTANTKGVPIIILNGGNIKSIKNVLPALLKIDSCGILFIDEIHRMSVPVCEFLYTAMEDFRIDVGSSDGLSIKLPKFTLIGATTEGGKLPKPLYDRFVYKFNIKPYSPEVLSNIISNQCNKIGLSIDFSSASNIALRSRNTPRVALNIVQWMYDYCISNDITTITEVHIENVMKMMKIDKYGVTDSDRIYIECLKRSNRKPVGLKYISDSTGIDEQTILNSIEPFLIKLGLIIRTSKGRILNDKTTH